MKKLLISLITFLLLLVVFISTARAQIYVTLERPPSRLGVLYNQRNILTQLGLVKYNPTEFLSKMGLYVRTYCGKIQFSDFHTTNLRIGIGTSFPFHLPFEEPLYGFYIGPAYDLFYNTSGSDPDINITSIFPVSIDMGVTMECERVRILMLINPCYKESVGVNISCSIGFSYKLKR